MTQDEFRHLAYGDLVRHKLDTRSFVVTGNFGDRVMAVASVDITNHDEWELVAKSNFSQAAYNQAAEGK